MLWVVAFFGAAAGIGILTRGLIALRRHNLVRLPGIAWAIVAICTGFVAITSGAAVYQRSPAGTLLAFGGAILLGVVFGLCWGRAARILTANSWTDRMRAAFEIDTRIVWIVLSILLALAATWYFAVLAGEEQRANTANGFWFAFYTSWTAGLVFWAIVGVIGTVVALARPEDEIFDRRISILFGGRRRAVVRYLGQRIRALGYWAPEASRRITVEEWDPGIQAYKMRTDLETTIQNLLHDENAREDATIRLRGDPLGGPVPHFGQLLSVTVDGQSKLPGPLAIPPHPGALEHPFLVDIPPGKSVRVVMAWWFWASISEEHSFAVARFTERMRPSITYRANTPGQSPQLSYSTRTASAPASLSGTGTPPVTVPLRYDTTVQLPEVVDLEPREDAFLFRLSAPM